MCSCLWAQSLLRMHSIPVEKTREKVEMRMMREAINPSILIMRVKVSLERNGEMCHNSCLFKSMHSLTCRVMYPAPCQVNKWKSQFSRDRHDKKRFLHFSFHTMHNPRGNRIIYYFQSMVDWMTMREINCFGEKTRKTSWVQWVQGRTLIKVENHCCKKSWNNDVSLRINYKSPRKPPVSEVLLPINPISISIASNVQPSLHCSTCFLSRV